ncbi:hypothetical protein [Hymenobacter algoricola]|uniref:Glycerophosphoryl diester phosphodiesterase membrane domain-containing protein n=1 Tax=Hymenobacter algoricola TaxID=486267 RepID=A0ABP7NKU5_9BACT
MAHLPFTRPTDFLREREFGPKIEASFDFVRAHFLPLGRCLVYIVLPLLLLQGIATGLMQARMGGVLNTWRTALKNQGNQAASMQRLTEMINGPEYWLALVASLFSFTLLVLTVYGYVVLRLEKEDPAAPVTVPEVWALVRQRFVGALLSFFGLALGVVVAAAAISFVLIMLGRLLSTNPAMAVLLVFVIYGAMAYAMVVLSLFFIVQLRERTGFFATIGRCFTLVWGKWWSTFGLIVVMSILLLLLVMVVYTGTTLISAPFAIDPGHTPTVLGRITSVVAACLNSVAFMALYPLLFLALAFQYFNLVERKEGHGLHALVNSIGRQPEPLTQPRSFPAEDEGEY